MYMNFSIEVLNKRVEKAAKDAMTDVTADLLRVATERVPVDSTTLEKSGRMNVKQFGNKVTGQVDFYATSGGRDYAERMETGKYNLGPKSKMKSAGGVTSKFYRGALKVGPGYLFDTAAKSEKGYQKHFKEKVIKGL